MVQGFCYDETELAVANTAVKMTAPPFGGGGWRERNPVKLATQTGIYQIPERTT
jgi:hypothetical protein